MSLICYQEQHISITVGTITRVFLHRNPADKTTYKHAK